jgi:hypothetical protein
MTDYSTWHRCQWIVEDRHHGLWEETEHVRPEKHACRNRGRWQLKGWTMLCKQHARIARHFNSEEILARIVSLARPPDGEL